MATQTIEIRAVDKTQRALGNINKNLGRIEKNTQNLERGFDNVLGKVVAIGTAIAGGFGLKKIIDVSSQVEQLNLRFAFLFQSVEEGSAAFEQMLDFASKVPFSLEQIAAGAGNLAVASANAEEFAKNLGITGNVAAVFGLDFQQASEQIQRAFSTGIASADIFRERGVSAFLGFQSGAKVTAEETKKRFEEVFGPGGPLADATLVLANTYDGVFSMIQDKFFKFTLALGRQGGIFDFVKAGLKALDTIVEQNFGTLEEFAAVAGKAFVDFVTRTTIGVAKIIDAVSPVFKFVASGVAGLFSILDALPAGVQQLGIVGFLMLGAKGKLITIALGAVFDYIREGVGYIVQGFGKMYGGIAKVLDLLGLLNDEQLTAAQKAVEDLDKLSQKLKTPMKELNEAAEEAGGTIGGPVEQAVRDFLVKLEEANVELQGQEDILKEIFKNQEGINNEADKTADKFKEITADLEFQNSLIGKSVEEQAVMKALKQAEKTLGEELTSEQIKQITNLVTQNAQQSKLNDKIREEKELRTKAFKDALKSSMDFYKQAFGIQDVTQLEEDKNLALQTINNEYRNGEIESEKEMLRMKAELNAEYQRQLDRINEQGLRRRIQNALSIEKEGTQFVLQEKDKEMLKRIGKEERLAEQVNKRIEFEKKSEAEKVQFGLEQATTLFTGLSKVNKKFFAAQKAAAIALAIVNTYQGATKALATYPPPFNFIAAAATVASGLAQVATIRAQTMQRGGALPQGQAAIVGEDGPELIVPKQSSTVIPREVADAIGDMGGKGNGPVIVNFNISTVDAQGFDELLIRRRGTITGIINNALTKQGKQGVLG